MTEAGWDDYISTDSVDTADPSTAVPEISADIHELDTAADLTDSVSDLDQVSLDSAAYQGDLAVDQQSWADWNSATADEAAGDAQDYLDYANEQAAAGNTEIAENAYAQAGDYLDYANDKYDAADVNETAVADRLDTASDYIGSVDAAATDTADATDYAADSTDYSTDSADYSTDSADYSTDSADYSTDSTDYSANSADYSADASSDSY